MKHILTTVVLLFTCIGVMSQTGNNTFLYDTLQCSDGGELLFRKLEPINYVEGKKYPLVLFLHGAGQRGSDNEKQLELGGDMFANTTNRLNFPAFIIAPQCPSDNYWAFGTRPTQFDNSSCPADYPIKPIMVKLKELLDSYLSRPDVDLERVYITGLSMGAFGTYDMVCRFPDIFAAAVPICGGVNLNRLTPDISHVYWRLYHGDIDPIVPVGNSRQIYSHLLSLGADAEYIEYSGIQHEAWGPAFNSSDFLSWIFSKTHKNNDTPPSLPDTVTIGISTAAGLDSVRFNPSRNFKLLDNIDLTDFLKGNTFGWTPIENFRGNFDGNGKVISGLKINRLSTDNVGLFGEIWGNAVISDLGIVTATVNGRNNVGILLGKASAGADVIIRGCFVKGDVYATEKNVGGIVGQASSSFKIENCYSAGTVHGSVASDRVGGILGFANASDVLIDRCYSIAPIWNEGTAAAAGIVGSNNNKITISNCAAMNPSVDGKTGSYISASRVLCWESTATYENNIAFDGMLANGSIVKGGISTNKDGAGKTKEELRERQTYDSNGLGWNFSDVWTMGNGDYPLPVLTKIDAMKQPEVCPSHLLVLSHVDQVSSATLKIYPNPAKDIIAVECSGLPDGNMQLIDIEGNRIMDIPSTDGIVDIGGLVSGVYFIKADKQVIKFIKQ